MAWSGYPVVDQLQKETWLSKSLEGVGSLLGRGEAPGSSSASGDAERADVGLLIDIVRIMATGPGKATALRPRPPP